MAYQKLFSIAFMPGKTVDFLHELVHIPDPPTQEGDFRPPHAQSYCELIFFVAGAREIRVGNSAHVFRAGDILCVRPDEPHASRNVPCLLDRYYLHIPPDAFDGLCGGGALMRPFYGRRRFEGNRLHPAEEARREIFALLARIEQILRFSSGETRDLEAFSCVVRVLSLLCAAMDDAPPAVENGLLLKVLSYLDNAYADARVLSTLPARFHISRSTLWRLFSREMRTTPQAYLSNLRLESARRLLDDGADVLDAALQCGFCDSSHLVRCFRARYGMTPGQYRREARAPEG